MLGRTVDPGGLSGPRRGRGPDRQICADVAAAVRAGRNCLVLSQWTEHLARLAADARGARPGAGRPPGRGGQEGTTPDHRPTRRRSIRGWSRPPRDRQLPRRGLRLPAARHCCSSRSRSRSRVAWSSTSVACSDRSTASRGSRSTTTWTLGVPVLARMHSKRLAAYASLGLRRAPDSGRSTVTQHDARLPSRSDVQPQLLGGQPQPYTDSYALDIDHAQGARAR